ncbi:MAG: hypothetical protein U9N33_09045 [Campylobacterota bacterium]|nr:hypothetical protein [Campylobacterota bacterium]
MKIIFLQILSSLLFLINASDTMGNCSHLIIDERLPNVISSNMTLSSSKVYGIDKKVIVQNGATLTIEPGTTLAGCSLFSYLVISKNSKIIAKGTKNAPIVFTSQMDLQGFSSAGDNGEWGGVVIAGNAYTHYENNRYEADESVSFGSQTHKYDNESSGILEYVLIKHTGYQVKKDKELNGLSLAGVGRNTVIKNIAIIGGQDDGIEIWGGCVNIDGLYIYNAEDDSLDVDLGYRGNIKNVLIVQNRVASKNNHDSSAMEFGNDKNLITTNQKDATLPHISNLTAYIEGGGIYNKYDAGFRLSNVKIMSDKSQNNEMVYFRGKDSYTTGAKYIDGDVCFVNSQQKVKLNDIFSKKNSKAPKKDYTAYNYFVKNHKYSGKGKLFTKNTCLGADEKSIWKGRKGSYVALESNLPTKNLTQSSKTRTTKLISSSSTPLKGW